MALPTYHNGDKFGASDVNAIIDEIERVEGKIITPNAYIVDRTITSKENSSGTFKWYKIFTKYSDGVGVVDYTEEFNAICSKKDSGIYEATGGTNLSGLATIKSITATVSQPDLATTRQNPLTIQFAEPNLYKIWGPEDFNGTKVKICIRFVGTWEES